MITEKDKQNRDDLFRLMQENPDLPVIPMVDSEIVASDDYGRWIGSWGASYIDHFILGEERILFIDDDEEDVLADLHGYEWVENATDEEWATAYENIPWITAIIVNIDLPEI